MTGSGYAPKGEFTKDGKEVSLKDYPAVKTALWIGTLNNDALLEHAGEQAGEDTYRMVGDPTEGAILVAALKAGCSAKTLNNRILVRMRSLDSIENAWSLYTVSKHPLTKFLTTTDEGTPNVNGISLPSKAHRMWFWSCVPM